MATSTRLHKNTHRKPRDSAEPEQMIAMQVKMPRWMRDRLDERAAAEKTDASKLVRAAISRMLGR